MIAVVNNSYLHWGLPAHCHEQLRRKNGSKSATACRYSYSRSEICAACAVR